MTTSLNSTDITMGSSNMSVGGSAPSYPCRAWVKFNSGGGINAGGNVSSVSHPVTGRYYIYFSTSMTNAYYALSWSCGRGSYASDDNIMGGGRVFEQATNYVHVGSVTGDSSQWTDCYYGYVAIFTHS